MSSIHSLAPTSAALSVCPGVLAKRDAACRGTQALVHHWYLPDSYDSWMPAAEAPEGVQPDTRPSGAAHQASATSPGEHLMLRACSCIASRALWGPAVHVPSRCACAHGRSVTWHCAGPWRVSKRWLTDSALYNEWMNEIDYEPEDAGDAKPAAGVLTAQLPLSAQLLRPARSG